MWNFHNRQIVILLQVVWMLFSYPSPEGYVCGAVTMLLFAAQVRAKHTAKVMCVAFDPNFDTMHHNT